MTTALPATALTLGRLVVLVRDYDEALHFYQRAFGAAVLHDAPAPSGDRYLHLGFGDSDAGIWLLRARGEGVERVGRQTAGEPLAVFYTDDAAAAVARAQAAGATLNRPLESADGATFAHVADLYGNEFLLVQLASDR